MAQNYVTGRPVDKNRRVVWGKEKELKDSGGQ